MAITMYIYIYIYISHICRYTFGKGSLAANGPGLGQSCLCPKSRAASRAGAKYYEYY